MKTEPQHDAYPCAGGQQGLTKREEFAKAALQGLLSGDDFAEWTPATAPKSAVEYADALIAALNATQL